MKSAEKINKNVDQQKTDERIDEVVTLGRIVKVES